jgi:hypothetical protein
MNVYWYINEKLVHTVTQRDTALTALMRKNPEVANTKVVGIAGTIHRLCMDPYMIPNAENTVKCGARSVCIPDMTMMSEPAHINAGGKTTSGIKV